MASGWHRNPTPSADKNSWLKFSEKGRMYNRTFWNAIRQKRSCVCGHYLVLFDADHVFLYRVLVCLLLSYWSPVPLSCSGKAASGRDTLDNATETGSVVSQRREREKPRKKHNNDHGQQGLQGLIYSPFTLFIHIFISRLARTLV